MSISEPLSRHARNWLTPDEHTELRMLCDIGNSFRHYGEHPHCAGCAEECRQPNAPNLVIVFCPRMRSVS